MALLLLHGAACTHSSQETNGRLFLYFGFFLFKYVIKVRGGFPWVFTSALANLVSLRGLPPVVRRLPSDLGTDGYANDQAALILAWSNETSCPLLNYV